MTVEPTDDERALKLLRDGLSTSASIARRADWSLERAQAAMWLLRDQGRVEYYMDRGGGCTIIRWHALRKEHS